jgi:hypothetical protein
MEMASFLMICGQISTGTSTAVVAWGHVPNFKLGGVGTCPQFQIGQALSEFLVFVGKSSRGKRDCRKHKEWSKCDATGSSPSASV